MPGFRNITERIYGWVERSPRKRKLENRKILELAKESYDANRGICGLDKILADVQEKYPQCSRNRLYSIQKEKQSISDGGGEGSSPSSHY